MGSPPYLPCLLPFHRLSSFTDLVFVVSGGAVVRAHRAILSYFCTFLNQCQESQRVIDEDQVVFLPDFSKPVVESLILLLYSGSCPLPISPTSISLSIVELMKLLEVLGFRKDCLIDEKT